MLLPANNKLSSMRYVMSALLAILLIVACDSGPTYDWVFQERCEITPTEMRVEGSGAYEIDFRNEARGPVRQIEVSNPESDQNFLFVNPSGLYGLESVHERKMPDQMDKGQVVTVQDTIRDYTYGAETYDVEYADAKQRFSCEVGT